MSKIIYDPGTGTVVGLDGAQVVELPEGVTELEDIESFLEGEYESVDLNQALILPMTALDNAVLKHDENTPDIEWQSQPQQSLWIGVGGLSIKLKHEDEGVVVDVYEDPMEEASGSTWVEFPA